MSRRAQTDEQRTLGFIETATKEQLAALIQTASTVQRAKYPADAQLIAQRRTRGPAKPKANGAVKESAGVGFEASKPAGLGF